MIQILSGRPRDFVAGSVAAGPHALKLASLRTYERSTGSKSKTPSPTPTLN